jgi:hypothetical protein
LAALVGLVRHPILRPAIRNQTTVTNSPQVPHILEIQGAVGLGGSERHTLQLTLGLHTRPGFQVTVVGPYSNNPEMYRRILQAGIPLYEFDSIPCQKWCLRQPDNAMPR